MLINLNFRQYLDNLVGRIREHEERHAKLKAKLSRFDKQSQQELDEVFIFKLILITQKQFSVRIATPGTRVGIASKAA